MLQELPIRSITGLSSRECVGGLVVRQWICVIAGGPDHGAAIPQWVDEDAKAPEPFVDSGGSLLSPVLAEILPNFFRAVLAHPEAAVAQLAEAGDIVHLHDPARD